VLGGCEVVVAVWWVEILGYGSCGVIRFGYIRYGVWVGVGSVGIRGTGIR
jgi:hypothetical protein